MTKWLRQTQAVNELAQNLLRSQHMTYKQDYLRYKMLQMPNLRYNNFNVINGYRQRLYATLFIQHVDIHEPNFLLSKSLFRSDLRGFEWMLPQNTDDRSFVVPKYCIIFLHGYGSNRFEGLTVLNSLPSEFALCCFDFSGSGKSEGTITTFGLKEHQDIQWMIRHLKTVYHFEKVVLWGRSMGAVTSLLYTCNFKASPKSHSEVESSLQRSRMSAHEQEEAMNSVIFQVLDSPFSTFRNICAEHAKNTIKFPEMFIDFGISILESNLETQHFNPFEIQLPDIVSRCTVPALFMYCEGDRVISPENSRTLISNFNPKLHYEKIFIEQNHNTERGAQSLKRIFMLIRKVSLNHQYQQKQALIGRNLLNFKDNQQTERDYDPLRKRIKRQALSLHKDKSCDIYHSYSKDQVKIQIENNEKSFSINKVKDEILEKMFIDEHDKAHKLRRKKGISTIYSQFTCRTPTTRKEIGETININLQKHWKPSPKQKLRNTLKHQYKDLP